jgi:hypothetical protein
VSVDPFIGLKTHLLDQRQNGVALTVEGHHEHAQARNSAMLAPS